MTVTPRTPGSRGLSRIERKYLYEKNDPVSAMSPEGQGSFC